MQSLGADLASAPQRERAGPTTQERFDFQALCGMMLLFKQHDSEGNYAVIFEFHDDLAVVDDPDAPGQVRFFQVKTKDTGPWSLADLKRRKARSASNKSGDLLTPLAPAEAGPKLRGPSILGKMFHNIRQFGDRVASVTFMSNASCELHTEQIFDFRQCAPAIFATLMEAVQAEYQDATDDEVALLGFERTDLSLQDGSTHMKGKLHDFVKRHVGADEFPLDSLFRIVVDECRKRSKYTGAAGTFGDVIRLKGITRADVQKWLDEVKAVVRIPSWEELSVQLNYPFQENLALRSAWSVYRAEVLSQADEALRSIRRAIRDRIVLGFGLDADLMAIIDAIFADVEDAGRTYLAPFQPARLRAMIIYELYTQDAA